MTLPEDQIECLRIAGTLHDIGKIGVPSEILSKPARLNDEEYALIKRHSVLGEEILKDVDFPWPVGKIIRQHHERLDGSGYPDGLMGEDILFEAKVIAVADVVHAMMLPRSYRVGLGPEIAAGEIRKNRGRLYDPEIVDACLAIFDEKPELLQPDHYERTI